MRLSDFVGSSVQAPKALEAIKNPGCGWFYRRDAETFRQIPGAPIAYWASDALMSAFSIGSEISSIAHPCAGFQSGNAAGFMFRWWEEPIRAIKFDSVNRIDARNSGAKWFPCKKGGEFRKWFGNNTWVVNWQNDGFEMRRAPGSVIRNPEKYFLESITWTKLSSSLFAMRFAPAGMAFDQAGSTITGDSSDLMYLLGLLNSSVGMAFLKLMSPTLTFGVGDISQFPVLGDSLTACQVAQENVTLSLSDWDSFETSWDFKRHPLL